MEIIERLKKLRSKNRKIGIITFKPSPVSFLHKNEIFFLTTTAEKERILDAIEIDFIFYFKFDNEFAEKSPEQFVQLVYETIKPHALIVGENFHFGKGRKGSADLLDKLARGKFDVEIISTIRDQEGIISSTRIRELLLLGNIPGANRILGRNYALSGKVIKGKGKGTTLGFPTINLSVEKEKLLPLDGVYEVKLVIDNTP
ncbi:MAG: riboflavin kinase, partial [candidate division WOR-3 bacterium]